jgi:hypothetical protein
MEKAYNCPSPKCRRSYTSIADLFQHTNMAHKLSGRFVVVDRQDYRVYITDRAGVRIGELNNLDLKETEKLEVVAAV